jgi:serine/threonine-protein kinase
VIGKKILHYKIIEKLGEGGMGVVYKAEDIKLKRNAALKFLPTNALQIKEDKERFTREAQAAAALNHANIAHIYAIEEHEGQMFIVMEFIEGKSLEEIVGVKGGSPLKIDQATDYATQIAEGLQAAHEKGIIHRDIKSANIMVTGKGVVKIMDFGLAKLANRSKMTVQGSTLGTAAYMSPEQAKGEKLDHRSDIWSLGVVLYEMISGKLPFKGDYEQAVIYSILNDEPEPLTALRTGVPISLDGIIAKTLAKNPTMRYQHVDELPADLKAIDHLSTSHLRVTTTSRIAEPTDSKKFQGKATLNKRIPSLLVAVMTGAFLVMLTLLLSRGKKAIPEVQHLNISALTSQNQQIFRTDVPALAISSDGRKIAYSISENGVPQLYVRPLNSFKATLLSGTTNAAAPFFSPDGQWIGFLADSKLKKVAVSGGAVETICDAPGFRGASWGLNNRIILSPEYALSLMNVSSSGGEIQFVSKLDTARGERTHRWPQVLPGDDMVLYTIGDQNNPNSYTNAELVIQSLKTGERHILNVRGEMARYIEPGYLIVARNGALLAAPFDLKEFKVTEDLQLVVANVEGDPGSGISYFDISQSGVLVYMQGSRNEEMELVWVDRNGNVDPLPLPPKPYSSPRISPDGKKLAVTIGRLYGTDNDIWIYDLPTGVFRRLTFGQSMWDPVWSSDSRKLYFSSGLPEKRGIMEKSIDGSSAEQLVLAAEEPIYPISISPEGRQLILNRQSGPSQADILVLNLNDNQKVSPLFKTDLFEFCGEISSNGNYFAYTTNETKRFEIFINSYPDLNGKWQASTEGGTQPTWSGDGKELFYYTTQGKMMGAAIQTEPVFSIGKSRELFDITQMFFPNRPVANYDVTPDGQKFIMVRNASFNPNITAFNIIINFGSELENRFVRND